MVDDNGVVFSYTPDQGTPVELWQVRDLGQGRIVQELKGTEAEIRNADGSIKLTSAAGAELQLGDSQGRGLKIESGAIEITPSGVRLLSGPGVPTMTAPDGSIYLRTDGAAKSTFYVRADGVWNAK
jgi:hypothetical protein